MTRILLTTLLLGGLSLQATAQRKGCSTIESSENKSKIDFHSNASDTTKPRGLADNYYLWDQGAILKVKFLTGSIKLQNQVFNIAKEWEKYANIKFVLVKSGDADLRIKLGDEDGHNSYVGTVNKQITDQYEQTMNLATIDVYGDYAGLRRVALHEFGHAIGLLHEHSSPLSGINWNKEKLYAEYAKMKWTKEDVDYQVFRTFNTSYTNGTKYDNKSIMHYPIYAEETLDGYSVGWNNDLSAGDIELIKALYPMKGKRKNEVTRILVQNFGDIGMQDNLKKGGLSIFPPFDLKTGGKGGTVKMIFKFWDEGGYGLQDFDGKYQENGTVATIRTVLLPANKVIKYNQAGKKDFEFFIPFDQIPSDALYNSMIVTFKIVYTTGEGELKNLYSAQQFQYRHKK